jgi:HEAT repeat protein
VPGSFLSALPQFFVFPLILVATLTAVYLLLRMLAGSEPESAVDLMHDVTAAGPHGRAQLLHTLADGLRRGTLDLESVPTSELEALWQGSVDPTAPPASRRTLQSTLLMVLAHKHDPALTRHALDTLADPDPELRQVALMALAIMHDPATLGVLRESLASADPEERELALGALANLARQEGEGGPAREALAELLRSDDGLLARNAALQLGLLGDARAAPFVERMLVRESYGNDPALDARLASIPEGPSRTSAREAAVEQFLVTACAAAARLGGSSLSSPLQHLKDADPSLKVKSAAIDALHELQGSQPES